MSGTREEVGEVVVKAGEVIVVASLSALMLLDRRRGWTRARKAGWTAVRFSSVVFLLAES